MRYRTIGSDPATQREVSVLALGAMLMGTRTDEQTSYAILDRFVEAGGTFVDTANNYAFWYGGGYGGQSEALLARWRRDRGIGGEVVIATKLGGRPKVPNTGFMEIEGLPPATIRESAERSRDALGVERIDLLYAHTEDPNVPLEDVVEAFAGLVVDGTVGLLGASNHWSWRLEQARSIARARRLPGFEVAQYHHTYFRQRTDLPGRRNPDGDQGVVSGDLLAYFRTEPDLPLVAYTPLLSGAYVRDDRPLGPEHDHPGTRARQATLEQVVKDTGATANQVVLAWLLGGDVPMIPLVGASSVAQLEESLAAVDLELTADQRQVLDAAY